VRCVSAKGSSLPSLLSAGSFGLNVAYEGDGMTDIAAGATAPSDLFASASKASHSFAWSPQTKPLSGLAGWLKGGLWLFIAGQALTILLFGAMMGAFSVWMTDGGLENQQIAILAVFVGSAAQVSPFVSIGVFVLCVFLYLRFVYRAAKNLTLSRARGLDISPGWAVGWSFMPIVNLAMVYKVMEQIWQASADPVKNKMTAPVSLRWWWGLWLGGGVIARISDAVIPTNPGEDPTTFFDQFLPGVALALLGLTMAVVSTLLLMSIVKQITQAQETLCSTAVFQD
jgi:hypothetical protein